MDVFEMRLYFALHPPLRSLPPVIYSLPFLIHSNCQDLSVTHSFTGKRGLFNLQTKFYLNLHPLASLDAVYNSVGCREQQSSKINTLTSVKVYIRILDNEWNVYRRYTEFRELHSHLRTQFPQVEAFNFPPKKAIGNKSVFASGSPGALVSSEEPSSSGEVESSAAVIEQKLKYTDDLLKQKYGHANHTVMYESNYDENNRYCCGIQKLRLPIHPRNAEFVLMSAKTTDDLALLLFLVTVKGTFEDAFFTREQQGKKERIKRQSVESFFSVTRELRGIGLRVQDTPQANDGGAKTPRSKNSSRFPRLGRSRNQETRPEPQSGDL
ncbi:hypothetical protein F2P81_022071 [Scophthalmus maximus]|uniref:PX domain-containing protein n=1 Tax=Scophthalmus maximus TaxID=52904 RepID=A0A6A4S0N4_SCOMX|nr:hypothetical protein F2P81_022071 [Scophthalmus maximus]